MAFSPDGRLLASAGKDRTVRIWEVASGQEVLTLRGHTGEIYSVAFSSDGQRVASVGADSALKLWDVATGQETFSLRTESGTSVSFFSPDGKRLAAGSKVWDGTDQP